MQDLIPFYQQRLNLQGAHFSLIEHADATVAIVYKVTTTGGIPAILKICTRPKDYFNELFFLRHFTDTLPVPRIIDLVEPNDSIPGTLLLEFIPGTLVTKQNLTNTVACEIGAALAQIHLNRTAGYGNITEAENQTHDPRIHFSLKFQEGLAECANHLPKTLVEQCQRYHDTHINLLDSADGPCMTHQDFRAGNILVDNNKLQGIIDWAAGRAGFAQEDFCPLEHDGWPQHAASKQAFLEGYASIRTIPQYQDMMPLLKLNRAIALIGFFVKNNTWNGRDAHMYQFNRNFLESFFAQQQLIPKNNA